MKRGIRKTVKASGKKTNGILIVKSKIMHKISKNGDEKLHGE
jgi:hypothetical protein